MPLSCCSDTSESTPGPHLPTHFDISTFRVTEHAAQNKMIAGNIGVVFGPTLMRSEKPHMTDLQAPNSVGAFTGSEY